MTGTVNLREVILGILMEVTEGEAYSHIVLRDTLEKYQYLPKRDRAFVSRVTEGTLENLIQIDYIIECFSKASDQKYSAHEHLSAEVYGCHSGQRGGE